MISPVRRTTIVVSDVNRSLSFYRDKLGMSVYYDQEIASRATAKLLGVPDARVRLISLQSDESVNGMVGLLSFLSPEIKPRTAIRQKISDPDVALLFMADDIDIQATYKRLKGANAETVCAPLEYEVPGRGPVSGFTCMDPDGVLVALMCFGPLKQNSGIIKASPTRRTTLVTGDIDKSLAFYRDVIGLKVFYDQEIDSEGESKMLGIPGARIRMVSLQSGDQNEGMVGLMSFQSPELKTRDAVRKITSQPDICLIFLTDEIEVVYDRMLKHDVVVKCPPIEYEIPGRGISAGLTCYDPDGVIIEFTQFGPLNGA